MIRAAYPQPLPVDLMRIQKIPELRSQAFLSVSIQPYWNLADRVNEDAPPLSSPLTHPHSHCRS